jgi:hypothetical protein
MNIETKDGFVYKDGDIIATITGDVITGDVITSPKALGPTVKGAIKKALNIDKLSFIVAGIGETEAITREVVSKLHPSTGAFEVASRVEKEISDAELFAELQRRGFTSRTPAIKQEEPQFNARILNKQELVAKFSAITPPPATLPDMGDKTPAFVEWVRSHATAEEFAVIYPAHRKQPSLAERDAGEKVRIAKLQRLPSETTDKKGDAE